MNSIFCLVFVFQKKEVTTTPIPASRTVLSWNCRTTHSTQKTYHQKKIFLIVFHIKVGQYFRGTVWQILW